MLNFLTKTKPWMVASLFVAASAFGQSNSCTTSSSCSPKPSSDCCKPCKPPRELIPCPTVPAYNAPARIDTRCPWDVWVDASFIYWQPIQENMEPAVSINGTPAQFADLGTFTTVNGQFVNQNTKFKPGFKVGLGMNFDHDNWDAAAEYTRFHCTQKTSGFGDVYSPLLISPFAGSAMLTIFNNTNPDVEAFFGFSDKWRLNMDLVDLNLGRWYYVGTHLTFRPSVGARGAWINQKLNTEYDAYLQSNLNAIVNYVQTSIKTNSWAVGPRMGINTNWLLEGCNCRDGFRLYGNAYGDILFTRYTKFSQTDTTFNSAGAVLNSQSFTQSKINTLRTHVELELGLGWGSYFDNNNWHIDLSAGYGFQTFFDQNMTRLTPAAGTFNPRGNLYIHGLTATVRLDF